MPAAPRATYRLQLTPSFTLERAAQVADYLDELGVSHIYTSPLLRAAAGSQHGYDVVSHDEVSPALGGDAARRALVAAARRRGLGLVIDIVPNHMGVSDAAENAQWWDVLRLGQQSRFADWFDIDWSGGKVLLPVLGDDADLERDLSLEWAQDAAELRYYEHRFPVAPGTAQRGDAPQAAHARQHYELICWRDANTRQNYRRFFAVTSLAGIRVERPEVFDATHRLFLQWIADGEADGLRVDHPDGLADPRGYLETLAARIGDTWLLVEKILEPGEPLPAQWPVHGTTGYDALAEVSQLFIDPAGQAGLDALNESLAGDLTWPQHVDAGKREVAGTILRAEILRMARLAPDQPHADEVLTELAVAFPVYRSYFPDGGGAQLDRAAAAARIRRPDLIGALDALLPRLRDGADELCIRFQQATGAIMAKGVEDTAYYRYSRLVSLNEVGANPAQVGGGLEQFHEAAARRQADWPLGMTTLSTHDTKRSEDVRARIDVLSELPGEWARIVGELARLAPTPDPAFAHLLWQTVIGIGGPRAGTRDRVHAYAEKAMREEDVETSWANPEGSFERTVHAALDAAYDQPAARDLLERFAARIEPYALSNALSQKLVQLCMPGVPDVYQGTELWDDSLVDPDNRRAVDFAARRQMLAQFRAAADPPSLDGTGAAKLWAVSTALHARRDRPELFAGYAPVRAEGAAAAHLVGFDRGGAIALATRLPVGLAAAGGWGDARLPLPDGPWRDALTGLAWSGDPELSAVLARYPVALLLRDGASR